MDTNIIRILTIIILIIIVIITIVNVNITEENTKKSNSIELLSEEKIYDYIIDLWANFSGDNIEKYTKEQLVVISIVAYDSEINNGGLCQFFANSSRFFAPIISESLEKINAKKHKYNYDEFIKQNKINVDDLNSFISEDVDEFIEQYDSYPFEEFDMEFYGLDEIESLYDLVIEYAKSNYDEIFTK